MKKLVSYFALSLVTYFAVFSPVLLLPIAYHDDLNFFAMGLSDEFFKHPQSVYHTIYGRPIAAIILNLLIPAIDTVSSLGGVRFFGIIILSVISSSFALYLNSLKLKPTVSFLISTSIFLLPGVLFFIFMVQALHNIIPLLFTFLAAILSLNAFSAEQSKKNQSYITKYFLLLLSFLLVLISLFIYPGTSTFFVVPLIARILFSGIVNFEKEKKQILLSTAPFVMACFTFYVTQRFIISKIMKSAFPTQFSHLSEIFGGRSVFSLSSDLLYKVDFLIDEIFVRGLNLWNIYILHEVAFFVFACIFISLSIALTKFILNGQRVVFLFSLAGVLSLLLAFSVAPQLVASQANPMFRTLVPFSASIILFLVWAWRNCCIIFKLKSHYFIGGTALFFSMAVMFGSANILTSAVGQFIGYKHVETKLNNKALNARGSYNVHFIYPPHGIRHNYLGFRSITDEFNNRNTGYTLIVQSLLELNKNLKTDEHKSKLINVDDFPCVSASEENSNILPISTDAIIIDLNNLFPTSIDSSKKHDAAQDVILVDASSATCGNYYGFGFVGANVLRSEEGLFWQSKPGFPQWIKISFSAERYVSSYSLTADDSVYRKDDASPKSWVLQGSSDGNQWVDLDRQTGQINWRQGETRIFNIDQPGSFKFLRFVISEGNYFLVRVKEVKLIS